MSCRARHHLLSPDQVESIPTEFTIAIFFVKSAAPKNPEFCYSYAY